MLVYTSEPLERDLEVIGPVEMVLYAASSARDTDFFVRLCDVYPDGRSIFLTEGVIRARYRGSVEGESVELLEPGEVGRVPLPLLPGRERLQAGPPDPARRDELELPALLPQPQHGRGRRHGHPDGDRQADDPAHLAYPSHVLLPVIGVVSGGFPTYEAERALAAARAAGSRDRAARRHAVAAAARARRRGGRGGAAAAGWQRRPRAGSSRCARRSPRSSSGRPAAPSTPAAEILVTNGAMHALGICFRSLVGPGDEVVVPAPCFFFEGPIRAAGRDPVYVRRQRRQTAGAGMPRRSRRRSDRGRGRSSSATPATRPATSPRGRRSTRRSRSRHGTGSSSSPTRRTRRRSGTATGSPRRSGSATTWCSSAASARACPCRSSALESFPAPPGCSSRARRTLEWDVLRVDLAAQTAALAVLEGPRDWLDAVHAGLVADRAVALAAVAATPGSRAAVPGAAPFLFVHADSGAPVGGRARPRRAPGRRRRPLPGAGLRAASVRRGGTAPRRSPPRSPAGPRRRARVTMPC